MRPPVAGDGRARRARLRARRRRGLVVPAGDPVALADALLHLACDADLRERMGEAARLRMLQGYTHAHMREALRAAYQSLLGKKGTR